MKIKKILLRSAFVLALAFLMVMTLQLIILYGKDPQLSYERREIIVMYFGLFVSGCGVLVYWIRAWIKKIDLEDKKLEWEKQSEIRGRLNHINFGNTFTAPFDSNYKEESHAEKL